MTAVPVFGVRRLFAFLLLSGLAGTAASAQSNVVAPPPPARADTVGPEQLRNFALPGTQQSPAPSDNAPATTTPTRPAPATTAVLPPPVRERAATGAPARSSQPASTAPASNPAPAVSVPLPSPRTAPVSTTTPDSTSVPAVDYPTPSPVPDTSSGAAAPAPLPSATSDGGFGWPTMLLPIVALVLAGAGLAWWWSRRRAGQADDEGYGQLAFAGAPGAAMPSPAPAPSPSPAPEAPARAPSVGLVSSRLRAWLELELGVRVAAVTEEELRLEVDIILTNSGSAAAREIAVEALLINAGPNQEKEITTFFARPDADGFAAEGVAPMEQMALSASLVMPRAAFQEYAVGGGKVVVPIVAVNAGYKAGSSRGRTSAAFLVGRAGAEADKLGPFPTDLGAKGFNRLGLKRLPEQARR